MEVRFKKRRFSWTSSQHPKASHDILSSVYARMLALASLTMRH